MYCPSRPLPKYHYRVHQMYCVHVYMYIHILCILTYY